MIKTMKFSALSVAAIFALFAQTIAEPLATPTGPVVGVCPTQVFHCGYLFLFHVPITYLLSKVVDHV